ncbi:MAG: zinc-dependent alcohol dehydrogenase family protein [Pseudomonadota bacterium]
MRAIMYEHFGETPKLTTLPDPSPEPDGVVLKVEATGVCRSDWHGWKGHDPDITLPHVPGHELAGTIVACGSDVGLWKVGQRVTVPFVSGCGVCPQCHTGHQQVCDDQFQPGFTHWGSFAEYVSIQRADLNLVTLPETMDFATAASLGCRFATAFRAVVDQGKACAGQWVAVHGCGGVGLSAIMIANALGARVAAVDVADDKLGLARTCGAEVLINANEVADVVDAVKDATGGGVHVSLDALGHAQTSYNSVANLRKRGKHIQVGLLLAEESDTPLPMAQVIANELEIYGSHGMQAHRYTDMMGMITSGQLSPEKLIGAHLTLEQSIAALTNMDRFETTGVGIITQF